MCGKVQVNFKMLRYGTDIGTIETKQKKRKLKQNRRKRREKQNRRKDSERSKCCISCALRGGVQRGPIKGLDAAAQMRYTPQKQFPLFLTTTQFPLFLPSFTTSLQQIIPHLIEVSKGHAPHKGRVGSFCVS